MSRRDFSARRDVPRPATPLDWVLLLTAALAAGWVALTWQKTTAQSAELREQKEAVRTQIERLRGRARAPEGRETRYVQLVSQVAQAPPARVLDDLSEVLPDDVRVDSLTVTYGDTVTLDLVTVSKKASSYETFLARLGGAPAFTAVLPGEESHEAEVRAVVRAQYRGDTR